MQTRYGRSRPGWRRLGATPPDRRARTPRWPELAAPRDNWAVSIRAGIINVTGFAGMEAARILHRHPEVELVAATGRSLAGQRLGEAFPHLARGYPGLVITDSIEEDVDVVFSAMPTAESAAACAPFVARGIAVIDIAADFRLRDPAAFQQWFGKPHPAPELLGQAVYGLPELHASAIRESRLVANPGCYPSASILALAPAMAAGLIGGPIIVDAKSGISGAGRGSGGGFNYSNVNEDVSAYKVEGHNHQPEIVQELGRLTEGGDPAVTFVPHLVPMTRGILATCYAPLARGVSRNELVELYREFYAKAPFTHWSNQPPHTKDTLASNLCLVHATMQGDMLVAMGAIDNLVKGAAGQAIENMNLMCGVPQDMGLEALAVFP
jgi:N-acetyl-gamma-glutamyl-phosphate reductase